MCWVTTQLNRLADDKSPKSEDVAEAYEKVRILDIFMVLIRTITMRLKDEAKLFLTKNRDGPDGEEIQLITDLKLMLYA